MQRWELSQPSGTTTRGWSTMVIAEKKTPTIPITEIEQSAFCTDDDELVSKTLAGRVRHWSALAEAACRIHANDAGRPRCEDLRGARATLGQACHTRTSLPARRGDKVRRLPGRLLQAVPVCRLAGGSRAHHLLRRTLHGRDRGHSERAGPEGHPAQPDRRMLHGRHGPDRRRARLLGRPHPMSSETAAASFRSLT